MNCETPEEVLRQWALDTSNELHKDRSYVRAETVIRDAKKFYGYLAGNEGNVKSLGVVKVKGKR